MSQLSKKQAIDLSNIKSNNKLLANYDVCLIGVLLLMLGIGLVMVASSSIFISAKEFGDPLHYFWRQIIAATVGIFLAIITLKIPMHVWKSYSSILLIITILMLCLVLLQGVGKEVNGSMRWIKIGSFSLQVSEPAKIFIIAYLAGYIVRHNETLKTEFVGFIRPVVILTMIAWLLLLEPDFGSAVILCLTALGMLFMGGIPLFRFFSWVFVAFIVLLTLAIFSPYRMQRMTSFIDPWQDPYGTGFQLTQALIAFGRGEWFGVGLGGSIQKLFYLPEAHTDFVFAVLSEELGLLGSCFIILLYSFVVWRSFVIGNIAERMGNYFSAYFAYGIGLIIGAQAYINIGVNMGVLPTKGLTLPLISYGGNSLVTSCVLLAILLRIEYESRQINHDDSK